MIRHGTPAGYRDDYCRCAACRAAIAKEHNVYKMRRAALGGDRLLVSKVGAVRRVQSLAAIGWPRRELSRQAGYAGDALAVLLYGSRTTITRDTHARIAEMYERLCMTPGPSNPARLAAQKKGWPPPLAWDDIDTDEQPNLGSDGPRDLLAEFEHLTSLGESAHQAAKQLGVTLDAIEKAAQRQRGRAA